MAWGLGMGAKLGDIERKKRDGELRVEDKGRRQMSGYMRWKAWVKRLITDRVEDRFEAPGWKSL